MVLPELLLCSLSGDARAGQVPFTRCCTATALPQPQAVLAAVPRRVPLTTCGPLSIYGEKTSLSTALAGKCVGIKEIDDGIWIVSFMRYDKCSANYYGQHSRDRYRALTDLGR
jgi:hypothetical protein